MPSSHGASKQADGLWHNPWYPVAPAAVKVPGGSVTRYLPIASWNRDFSPASTHPGTHARVPGAPLVVAGSLVGS
jgi:hypothetical protein